MINIPIRVKNLIRKYGTSNPYDLSYDLNIEICECALPDKIRGFFVQALRKKFIVLNSEMTEIEKTIVLCHELGHVRLHSGYGYHFSASTTYFVSSKKEAEANLYCVYLLARRHDIDCKLVDRIISEKRPEPKLVHQILNDVMQYEF